MIPMPALRPRRAGAVAAVALLCSLSACSSGELSRTFGISRDSPDEFTVTTRAPLSVPPEMSLPPPHPGAPRPNEDSPRQAAEAALVPQAALAPAQTAESGAALSPGQQALLQASGPPAPADIRRKVDQEAALDNPGDSFVDRLMFWRSPDEPGVVVDPEKETQRLRENAALGQSPEMGDTPIIQRKSKSLLDGIF